MDAAGGAAGEGPSRGFVVGRGAHGAAMPFAGGRGAPPEAEALDAEQQQPPSGFKRKRSNLPQHTTVAPR